MMFKTVANEVWAFDAEWVPDPEAGRVLYRLLEALTDREVETLIERMCGLLDIEAVSTR